MKSKLHIKGIAALFALCVSSCEDFKFGDSFLEKPITTDLTIDSVFSHRKYAEQLLAEVYHSLPDFLSMDQRFGWNILESITDFCDSGSGANHYYTGQISASTSTPYNLKDITNVRISSSTGGIRQAYIYLENVDRVPDMTEKEKQIRKAEAKMIIAYHYMDMLRYFGGMPWIDHAYTAEEEMIFPRMTVEEHVNKIVSLCDEAAQSLPWSIGTDDEGRMTAAGALALKNRVLHFAASPLFNSEQPFMEGDASTALYTWYGNYDEKRWEKALEAGLKFLDANKENSDYYSLFDTGSPRTDYFSGYYDRCNKEALIVSHRYNKIDNKWRFCLSEVRYGIARPTAVYADMFEMKDTGEPFDWNNPKHAANPFFKNGQIVRDPRLYETLWVNGDKFRGRTFELYAGGQETWDGANNVNSLGASTYNGYSLRKFVLDHDNELFGHYYQCPLIRLPEIYLNIAEAMNELGIATQKDRFGRDAYDYINLVRNRVDMPDLNRDKYPEGEKLLEAILHERAVEFGFEEVRFFDINRRKRGDLLKKEYYRLKAYKENDGTFRYEQAKEVLRERIWVNRWTDRYYLIPIPAEEINKKYGLVQNPGW